MALNKQCPSRLWTSWYNFRNTELKFYIFPLIAIFLASKFGTLGLKDKIFSLSKGLIKGLCHKSLFRCFQKSQNRTKLNKVQNQFVIAHRDLYGYFWFEKFSQAKDLELKLFKMIVLTKSSSNRERFYLSGQGFKIWLIEHEFHENCSKLLILKHVK